MLQAKCKSCCRLMIHEEDEETALVPHRRTQFTFSLLE